MNDVATLLATGRAELARAYADCGTGRLPYS